MNIPRQVGPILRQNIACSNDSSRDATPRMAHVAGQDQSRPIGIVPLGYESCYRLRGPAQQMCLNQYR